MTFWTSLKMNREISNPLTSSRMRRSDRLSFLNVDLSISASIAHNVSPHDAVVFGATKDFLRLNLAYEPAPKTIERVDLPKKALTNLRFQNSLPTLARERRFAGC
jgi:hypothetical protein